MGKGVRATRVDQSDGNALTGEGNRTAVPLGVEQEHRGDVVQQVRRVLTAPAVVERLGPAENALRVDTVGWGALRLLGPAIVRRVHVQNRIDHSVVG